MQSSIWGIFFFPEMREVRGGEKEKEKKKKRRKRERERCGLLLTLFWNWMLIRCGCVPSDCQKVSERPSRRRSTPLPGCKKKRGEQRENEVEVEKKKKKKTQRRNERKKTDKMKTKKRTFAVDTLHWASPPTSRSLVSSSGGLAVESKVRRRGVESERYA